MTAKEKKDSDPMNEINRVPMSKDSRDRMTLNIYDLQYLIRLQDMSNDAFREELREIYLRDNDELVKNVTDKVCIKIDEFVTNVYKKLETLESGQNIISGKIDVIGQRVEHLETFEETAISDLKYLKKTQSWRTIAVRIAIAVLISTIITIVALWSHSNKTKTTTEKTRLETPR